jgi:hypothetical protein
MAVFERFGSDQQGREVRDSLGIQNFHVGRAKFGIEYASTLSKDAAMDQDRRRAPRFPFIASAEVLSESAGARLAARISDISATGCYVDTINPLMDGTPVRVRILTETQVFEAPATVVYCHSHLGMGLSFRDVLPDSQDVLQNWLPVLS